MCTCLNMNLLILRTTEEQTTYGVSQSSMKQLPSVSRRILRPPLSPLAIRHLSIHGHPARLPRLLVKRLPREPAPVHVHERHVPRGVCRERDRARTSDPYLWLTAAAARSLPTSDVRWMESSTVVITRFALIASLSRDRRRLGGGGTCGEGSAVDGREPGMEADLLVGRNGDLLRGEAVRAWQWDRGGSGGGSGGPPAYACWMRWWGV